jgi:alpha-glucosidase
MSSYTGNNLLNSTAPVDVAVGTRRARAAAMLTLGLPGAAYLYVGEELGLYEVLDIPADRREDPLFINTGGAELGRDGCRVPLPWSPDPATNFGFSSPPVTGGPWLPQPADWGHFAADAQAVDPASILSLYRRAVAVRRATPTLRTESFAWIDLGDDVVAFRRGDDVLVVLNAGPAPFALPPAIVEGADLLLASVFGHDDIATVPADGAAWLRLAR